MTKTNKPFQKIKIVQIGVRHGHANGIMAAMRQLPEYFDILGIAAESSDWEAKVKNQPVYKGLKWFDRDKILDLPGIEAVAVETEMTELVSTAVKCAERGLPIHIDKPLGEDLNECKKLLDLCQKKNVLLQPGYMFRGNPAIQFGIQAVQKGWLGEITDFYATMNRYDVNRSWRKWLSGYRGGGMFIVGSHIVDIILSMLGAPTDIQLIERPINNDGVSDNSVSLLIYPKAIAQIRVSLMEYEGGRHRRLIVAGTKGSFDLYPIEGSYTSYPTFKRDPFKARLTLKEDNEQYRAGTHLLNFEPPQGRYSQQMIDFAQCVRGLAKNPFSYEYELLVQKAILASSGYISWK